MLLLDEHTITINNLSKVLAVIFNQILRIKNEDAEPMIESIYWKDKQLFFKYVDIFSPSFYINVIFTY